METSKYMNEKAYQELIRLIEQHNFPVDVFAEELNDGSKRVTMVYDKRDIWLCIWLEDCARGRFDYLTERKTYKGMLRHEVVKIIQEKFLKYAIPLDMTIGKAEGKDREVTINYVESDMELMSWLVISSLDEYLNPREQEKRP